MMRGTPSVTTVATRLTIRHALKEIRFTFRDKPTPQWTAQAVPQSYHRVVHERRQEALERAAQAAGGTITIAEAARINDEVVRLPIAVGYGDSLEGALFDLERALKATIASGTPPRENAKRSRAKPGGPTRSKAKGDAQ